MLFYRFDMECEYAGGKKLEETGPFFFDPEEGGVLCGACRRHAGQIPLDVKQLRWMRAALSSGSASWVNTPDASAPFTLLRRYVEQRLGRRIRSGAMLPE